MSSNISSVKVELQTNSRRWLTYLVVGITLITIAFIYLYRLDTYPPPWHDEAVYLKVAKNYALNGVYANFSSEGNRFTGPVVSVGPTVILPIALLFKVFGVSFILGRVVSLAYLLVAFVCLYKIGEHFQDAKVGFVAVVLLAISPGVDLQIFARNVIGEVPALCLTVAALYLWLRPGSRGLLSLVGVGVVFGLAAISKNQYAFIILPSLLVSWIADLVWYKQRNWRFFVVPGVVSGIIFFAWTYYVLYLLGAGERNLAEDMSTLQETTGMAFFSIRPTIIVDSIRALTDREVYGGLLIPAMLYGLLLSLRRDRQGQQWGILFTIVLLGVTIYIFSIARPLAGSRWAILPVGILSLFVAHLLHRLTNGFQFDWSAFRSITRNERLPLQLILNMFIVGLFITAVLMPLYGRFQLALENGDDDGYRVAQYLQSDIPQDALIETWEEELSVLTDHTFHYPPQVLEARVIANLYLQGQPGFTFYDFREYIDPDMVIVGPFGSWAGIYPVDRLSDYELTETIGRYSIYSRRD